MAASPSLNELLGRWNELRQQGQSLSPEELCADCPELLAGLKHEIAAIAAMEKFLGMAPGRTRSVAEPLPTAGATHSSPSAQVPGYEILGEAGRGGMSVVYKARHIKLKRLVALKMILTGAHAGPADLSRFTTEAEAIARLQHPNIVQIYEIGECDGRPYLALEFVDGGSLAARLTGRPLPPEEAAALVETLARAMHAAHLAGIVHRDLKPANVLLASRASGGSPASGGCEPPEGASRSGGSHPPLARNLHFPLAGCTPKITDFGLAKRLDQEKGQTESGAILGTLSYMAPEQAGGRRQEVGPAVDIYALGAILYELVTGRPPFRAATLLDTVLGVLNDEPIPPGRLNPQLPRALEVICLHCLQRERHRRYADAAALADDLQRFRAGAAIRARPVGIGARLLRGCRRHPGRLALAGLFGLSVALLVALLSGIGRIGPAPGAAPAAPGSSSPSSAPVRSAADLQVVGLTIRHHRGEPSVDVGLLGFSSLAARFEDDVCIHVWLNQPGYCYLLAFNPDGKEQPCHPRDEAVPPTQSQSFVYPAEPDSYFPLNDGVGLQAFVLLASRGPLPPYHQWRASAGRAPWQAVQADDFLRPGPHPGPASGRQCPGRLARHSSRAESGRPQLRALGLHRAPARHPSLGAAARPRPQGCLDRSR
jgi:serine/threonine protein kinase